MKTNKNIDRFFQENVNDFEATPNPKIWANIKFELDKEETKKRIIPFWWNFSGVAAILALGFFIGQFFENEKQSVTPNTSDKNNVSPTVVVSKENLNTIPTITISETAIIKNKVNTINQVSYKKAIAQKVILQMPNQVQNIFSKPATNQLIVNNVTKNQGKKSFSTTNAVSETTIFSNQNLVQNNNSGLEIDTREISFSEKIVQKATNSIQIQFAENPITNLKSTNQNQKDDSNNNSFSAVLTKTEVEQVKIPKENQLEAISNAKIANTKDKKEKQTQSSKWEIASQVAQVYMNTASNGSAIDPKYTTNSKSYDGNLSYGLGLKYALNKKLKLRTGINKVVFSYTTNDVSFYTSTKVLNPNLINVSLHVNQGIGLAFVNNTNLPITYETTSIGDTFLIQKGNIDQKMAYLEVPVEVSYGLLNNKFGINVIGGFSALFLNQNSVSAVSQSQEVASGKATNLNNIHFSTNVGIGFKYSLLPSLQLNIDPMLKYQVNTFNTNVGGFKPYFFGVYSGISYCF